MHRGKAGLLKHRVGHVLLAEIRWPWPGGLRPVERLLVATLAGMAFVVVFHGLLLLAALFDTGAAVSLFFPISGLWFLFGFLLGPLYLPVPIIAVLAGDTLTTFLFDPDTALHLVRQGLLYGGAGALLRRHYGRTPGAGKSARLGALLGAALAAVVLNLATVPVMGWADTITGRDASAFAFAFVLGDASGLLLVAPPALLLADRLLERRRREAVALGRRDQLIAVCLLAAAAIVVLLALTVFEPEVSVAATLTPALLPILIGAMLFGYTAAVVLFSAATALLLAASSVVADPPSVLALQTVLVVCCIATLAVGAATDDRKTMGARLDATVAERTRKLDAENAALVRRNAALRAVATTDHLTGLANRRAFERELHRRLARQPAATGLLLLDVDRFKRINDAHGHSVGDQALAHIAQVLTTGVRDNDHLARIGGEEFAVLCTAADVDQLHQVAERLRRLVLAAPLPLDDNDERLAISISVGGTLVRAPETMNGLLRLADRALYAAKRAGRNRSRIVEPPDSVPATLASS